MDISIINAGNVATIPVVIGLVSALKISFMADRYAPLASIVLGILGAFVFPAATVPLTILAGLVIGLSASGLYSGTKATVQG